MEPDKTVNDELEVNAEDNDNSYSESEDAESESEDRTYTAAELAERIKEARREQDKRWKERIKGLEGKEGSEKNHQEADTKKSVTSDNEVTLARLEARGVTEPDVQEYLLTIAKREGKHPVDLLNDDYVQGRIEAMKKEKAQKAATPDPSRRTGSNDKSKDITYWVEQAKQGKSAPTAELRRKVRAKLSGRA